MSSSFQELLQAVVGHAYQIERELPGAGMSRVFLAREPALARDVVIKVLPPDLLSTASLQRFSREVEVTARLQHPYILPVITTGGTDDLRYYITPFIRGESLRVRLATGEAFSFADAVRIGDQLLQALAFAHARGVIHRDVKPGNILLSDGHAILADFGIASFVRVESGADHADHPQGSTLDHGRVYNAPEQPREEARDLYAAAVVIHEMATGKPAAAGTPSSAIVAAIRARHPRVAVADARRLASILARAISIDPRARYASANELRAAMHGIGRGSRRQLLAGISVGGVAAVFAGAMFALTPRRDPPPFAADSIGPAAPIDTPRVMPVQQGEIEPAARRVELPMPALDSAALMFRHGDLAVATGLYQLAAQNDPDDSRAQLGFAVAAGMPNVPADNEASRAAAERALRGQPALDAHDRAIAEGLIALAERRYPDACAAFERARDARETLEANFGLGECRLRDDAVVFDADGTPRFRSSFPAAFSAYAAAARTASVRAPAVVYRRMTQTVPQTGADLRIGLSADGRRFAGHWRISSDTLAFVLAQSGVPRAVAPETFVASAAAANAGRAMLRPVLLAWVKQSPTDPSAWETLALLLENSGTIDEVGDDRISALTAIERARALERAPTAALRLATVHGRLLLRARHYEALATLADSLLAAHAHPAGPEVEPLLPLALLTGRGALASELLAKVSGTGNRAVRGADGRPVELPPSLIAERASFLVRASLGVCDERLKAAPRRLIGVLDAAFPAGVPRGVEQSFLERAVMFALPCVGPAVVATMREPGRSLPSIARAFDPTDNAFPAEFAARERARPAMTPGAEAGVDGVIVEVLAKLAMNDSASALRTLTLALDRVPILNRGLLSSEWSVGSIVRGMGIAAEVGAALDDRETAQRWAPAIATLWRNADPELQPVVARARAIAGATPAGRSRE